jgi:amidase
MTITELTGLIQAKEVSPVEITEHILDRIGELDKRYKSYATVLSDQAMDSAKKAEQEIVTGHSKGPLHGVPIAVKDLCFTAGVKTMGGCKVMSDFVPAFDATVVSRLANAGSILVGKLNLTEGAMGGYNPDFDVPLNPWDVDRWAGASSSGSGVSTALGLNYGSLGSDTGGSIRFPAASCGTVGLKPTWGRVSRYGVLALAESLDHVGPLTRSSSDAGIILEAIAGLDPNDPTTLPSPSKNILDEIDKSIKGVRIGVDRQYIQQDVDPEVSQSVLDAIQILAELGAQIVDVKMPDVDQYLDFWPTLCSAEALYAHQKFYPSRRDEYGPYFQGWLDMGASVTGAAYAEANNQRNECNGLVRLAFQGIDALACPSTVSPAHPISMDQMYGPRNETRGTGFQKFSVPFDYNGAPTLSVPCGFSKDGMPISLQLVGQHLSEALLCRIGHAYEGSTPWNERHPVP